MSTSSAGARLCLVDPDVGNSQLKPVYDKAFKDAKQLLILSAYLTEWSPKKSLTSGCNELIFVVGTDFGLTRKAACKAVLSWLPKSLKNEFHAAHGVHGFHPKVIAWRDHAGNAFAVVGSSNLTSAAFAKNREANSYLPLESSEFERLWTWGEGLRDLSVQVTDKWLRSGTYKEGQLRRGPRRPVAPPPAVGTPVEQPPRKERAKRLRDRRAQQAAFKKIQGEMSALVKRRAKKKGITNLAFYDQMMDLWSLERNSRFQRGGFEIKGRRTNWHEACLSLEQIHAVASGGNTEATDAVVRAEIDRLAVCGVTARGAWLSEMLCHYYPRLYPVFNSPIATWLRAHGYRAARGSSPGARYIQAARRLRQVAVQWKDSGVHDLSEVDVLIWQAIDLAKQKKKK